MRRAISIGLGALAFTVVLVLLAQGGAVPNGGDGPVGTDTARATVAPSTPTEYDVRRGHDPVRRAELDVRRVAFDRTNAPVSISISVSAHVFDHGSPPEYGDLHYEDVMLCLYGRNGTLLHGETLGTISLRETDEFHRRYTIDATVGSRPRYVAVDHPDLRGNATLRPETLVWNADGDYWNVYQADVGAVQDRFAFPRTTEVGTCG